MLNRLDDFPIHQTSEPLAHPANSDHNVYDRTWFNGYSTDHQHYFGVGLAVYPHRRIMDCALSTVSSGGRQHSFFGSRRAPDERTEMTVGPFRIEVVEPMRTTRVILDENPSGLACDLTFTAHTAPIEEAHQTLWDGTRKWMDAARFDQFGHWDGTLAHPDGELAVRPDSFRATKDRSWGVRNVGDQPVTAPGNRRGLFFLWAPLMWDDHVSHAIFFDDPEGRPLVREGLTAPLLSRNELASPLDATADRADRMLSAAHRVVYHPGTRLAAGAEIDLVPLDGPTRTIVLEPTLTFHMRGLGYSHPTRGHGWFHGTLDLDSESIEVAKLDLLAPENIHVQQVVRATDNEGRTGIGVLEQLVFGPYRPGGFQAALDGAP